MLAMLTISACEHHKPNGDIERLKKDILPGNYDYLVCEYDEIEAGCTALFRLNISTRQEADMWLDSFTEKTKTTLRVNQLFPSGTKNNHKIYLRCQHNTYSRSSTADARASSKNTNCPATMVITVKRQITNRKSRSSDIHVAEFPMIVRLNFNHNHQILCAAALRHRDVSDAVAKKFLNMFEAGHSPSTALRAHKRDLLEEHGNDYVMIAADRAECPDQQWCFRLYYKILKENYKEHDGKSMLKPVSKKRARTSISDTR